jgi:hypothetical protein
VKTNGIEIRVRPLSVMLDQRETVSRIPLPALLELLGSMGYQQLIHRRFEFGLNNLLVV